MAAASAASSAREALGVDLMLKIAEWLDGRALAALESVSTHFAEKEHVICGGDVGARVTLFEQVDDTLTMNTITWMVDHTSSGLSFCTLVVNSWS
jgi:hypothetical protein